MNLRDIPTPELRRIIRATEQVAGTDSVEALVLRRELVKRQQQTRRARRQPWPGGGYG